MTDEVAAAVLGASLVAAGMFDTRPAGHEWALA